MSGKGCESKDIRGKNGDLQIIFLHNYDTNKYIVQGNVIYEKVEVNYYDALLGAILSMTAPNGQHIDLTLHQCTKDGDNVLGDSVNGFEYRYIISIKYPNKLKKEERKLLEKIRKEYK